MTKKAGNRGCFGGLEGNSGSCLEYQNSHFQEMGYFFKNPVRFWGKLIFRVPRLESATPLLNTLHWLPVKKRIIFKTLLYVYKVLNGLAPAYLTQFISLYTVPREGLRSAKDTLRLNVPRTQLKISDGSFSSFGPKNWNKLPVPIRTSHTVATYKTQLKTHLFVHK